MRFILRLVLWVQIMRFMFHSSFSQISWLLLVGYGAVFILVPFIVWITAFVALEAHTSWVNRIPLKYDDQHYLYVIFGWVKSCISVANMRGFPKDRFCSPLVSSCLHLGLRTRLFYINSAIPLLFFSNDKRFKLVVPMGLRRPHTKGAIWLVAIPASHNWHTLVSHSRVKKH